MTCQPGGLPNNARLHLPTFMAVLQPSSLRLRIFGQQWAPIWVLENLVDIGALRMVVRCPLVSHHLDKETADCKKVWISPSATRSR